MFPKVFLEGMDVCELVCEVLGSCSVVDECVGEGFRGRGRGVELDGCRCEGKESLFAFRRQGGFYAVENAVVVCGHIDLWCVV